MHGAAVGTARQLAGGSMCWVGSRDAHQHIGATPGVQTAQLQRMTHGDLHHTYSWNILVVAYVGSNMWNMISVGWILAVLHESVGNSALVLPCRNKWKGVLRLKCAQIWMRFLLHETEVPAAVSMMATVVWALTPFTVVDRPQSFRGPSCLHLQGEWRREWAPSKY